MDEHERAQRLDPAWDAFVDAWCDAWVADSEALEALPWERRWAPSRAVASENRALDAALEGVCL